MRRPAPVGMLALALALVVCSPASGFLAPSAAALAAGGRAAAKVRPVFSGEEAEAAPTPAAATGVGGLYPDDQIPGKITLDVATLQAQQKDLENFARQLRRERLDKEAEESRVLGFTPTAEIINGRAAMFFITVGVATEYWTGESMPKQVETLLSTIGLLPLDYESMF
jgi:hypothetical protein